MTNKELELISTMSNTVVEYVHEYAKQYIKEIDFQVTHGYITDVLGNSFYIVEVDRIKYIVKSFYTQQFEVGNKAHVLLMKNGWDLHFLACIEKDSVEFEND